MVQEEENLQNKKVQVVMDRKEKREIFNKELKKVRSDFNDYTSYIRGASYKIAISIIIINWFAFGKSAEYKSIVQLFQENCDIFLSLIFAAISIFLLYSSSIFYTFYLFWQDKKLQEDFEGSKDLFNERNNPNSSYPYCRCASKIMLGFDIIICILLTLSSWFLIKAALIVLNEIKTTIFYFPPPLRLIKLYSFYFVKDYTLK